MTVIERQTERDPQGFLVRPENGGCHLFHIALSPPSRLGQSAGWLAAAVALAATPTRWRQSPTDPVVAKPAGTALASKPAVDLQ